MSVVSPTVGLCTAGDSDIDNVSSDEEDVEEGGEPDEDDADSGDERGAAAKVCPCVLKLDASPALKIQDVQCCLRGVCPLLSLYFNLVSLRIQHACKGQEHLEHAHVFLWGYRRVREPGRLVPMMTATLKVMATAQRDSHGRQSWRACRCEDLYLQTVGDPVRSGSLFGFSAQG